MQDKIFKVKIFEVTSKSVKSVKVFSLEIFRLYSIKFHLPCPGPPGPCSQSVQIILEDLTVSR